MNVSKFMVILDVILKSTTIYKLSEWYMNIQKSTSLSVTT